MYYLHWDLEDAGVLAGPGGGPTQGFYPIRSRPATPGCQQGYGATP